MERLTKREISGITYNNSPGFMCSCYCDNCSKGTGDCDRLKAMVNRLAKFEDLEEQGLLTRLPCKVGDTVYVPTRNFVSELRITLVSVDTNGMAMYFSWLLNSGIYPNFNGFYGYELGKTVFLTREEAEKKLEEMKGEHDTGY